MTHGTALRLNRAWSAGYLPLASLRHHGLLAWGAAATPRPPALADDAKDRFIRASATPARSHLKGS